MNKIIIIGASANNDKYGNKAVKAYLKKGFTIFPINPNEKEIEGIKCYDSIQTLAKTNQKIELASLYLPPHIGIKIIENLPKIGVKKIYLNPGTESDEIIHRLKELNIIPLMVCSIVAIGLDPKDL